MATQIARHWRMKSQRYQLTGHTCSQCNTPMFQSRPICPTCATETTQTTLNIEATINQDAVLIQVPHSDGLVIYHHKFNPETIKAAIAKN